MRFADGSSLRRYQAGPLELVDGTVTGISEARHRWPLLYLVHSGVTTSAQYGSDKVSSYEWQAGDIGFKPPRQDWCCQPTPHDATMMVTTGDSFGAAVQEHVDLTALEFRFECIRNPCTTHLFRALREMVLAGPDRLSEVAAETMGLALAVSVLREMFPPLAAKPEPAAGLSVERRRRVLDYIEANLSRRITIAELADVASLSQWHFCRSFQRAMGMTPARYIMARRIDLARRLLRTNLPALEVAMSCGFASQSHFCDAFKREVGRTPSECRLEASR
jgi:AraC-like DNA-binding protein